MPPAPRAPAGPSRVTVAASPQLDTIITLLEGIGDKLDALAGELVEDDTPLQMQFGQVTVATTGVAVRLGFASVTAVVVQALVGNASTVVIGTEGVGQTAGYQLQAGQAVGVNVEGLYQISVNGVSGDGVCWIGS